MKIALDLDGVLAQTYNVAFELMGEHEYSYQDIESWSWGLEKFGEARFLSAVWHSWTLRPHQIAPLADLNEQAELYELADRLDVVSADPGHFGIKDSKREWLLEHGVLHDRLRISPMGGGKEQYDYDIFIDDNPHMPSDIKDDQELFLYDAPYNQPENVDNRRSFHRVESLGEVVEALQERMAVA